MATLAEQIKKATHAMAGNPLNVADQGAYDSVFLKSPQIKWEPLQAESGTNLTAMPKGLMRATMFGDPNKPGFCIFRMKYPPNYHVPPHFHWMAEHTTVLEGEMWMGLGNVVDESAMTKYGPGDYFSVGVGVSHYVMTKDVSPIFELHVMGPWQMTYANPSDHPNK
jgi:quercetin dioxygenase-like cupin family protein